MRLDEYQWSRNPRGLHVASAFQTPMNYDRYTRPQMGWVKLLAATTDYVDDAMFFLERGITPIVRLYVARYGARPFTRELRTITDAFVRAGVKWFEFYNEPNLGIEWPEGVNPDWQDTPGIIAPLVDNWLLFAEYLVSVGCYPGFISLAESDAPRYAAVPWMNALLDYAAATHFDRFRTVLNNGMYVATHPYILNHFYQEVPGGGPTSARPPAQQNAREGGWHFEYPYDPISQRDDPGRTVLGGTALTPYGDPVGLTAMGRLFNERSAVLFGSQAVPVVGTEGGIWGFRGQTYQQDTRFPPYTEESQAHATVAMFEWIARVAQPWFFGLTLWKEDEYYGDTTAPAIALLEQIPPVLKEVPPFEVMGTGMLPMSTPLPPGPGPIRGEADFHIIVLAPGVEPSWFFDTARAWWDRFRPIVTSMSELIDLIPNTQSLAVTLITSPEMTETMTATITGRYPNVYLDIITITTVEAMAEIFNTRVRRGLRFG